MNLYCPFDIVEDQYKIEEELYNLNQERRISRTPLVNISIADIHFGAMDPEYQYQILKDQFLNRISNIYFDIISINGDLFDHKFMSNSEVILYAMKFIDDICNICRTRNNSPTLIIIAGTLSHDSNQLKLFYHYITDNSVDVRIVESTRFEYSHGAKILCIPEEYSKGENYYNSFLYHSGFYDMVLMHGTLDGAKSYLARQESGIHLDRAPIFNIRHFDQCTGYISSGHYHTAMCLNRYFYYSGSPLRWKFGEEEEKGFMIFLFNPDQGTHHMQFIPIISKTYKTMVIDDLLNINAMTAIQQIKSFYENNGIDNLRLHVLNLSTDEQLANIELIKKYFKHNNKLKILIDRKAIARKNLDGQIEVEENNEMDEYKFLLENRPADEKLVEYINYKKGYEYISLEDFRKILAEG